jgi:hypothetical protein
MSADHSTRASVFDSPGLFSFAGSAAAWLALGVGDILVTWRACLHQAEYGGPSAHPLARAVYFILTFALFGVAFLAGAMSYRKLSGLAPVLRAEGRECPEFFTLAGLFISLTLGAGIFWLCLPLFILQMCLRAR